MRDPSAPLDAVRVMTAHGAKGLQAPLVILADATADPDATRRDRVLKWTPEGMATPIPIFRPRAAERGGPLDAVVAEAEARELEEHWRLFYVAATRAEERLVIAGALGPRRKGVPPERAGMPRRRAAFDALGVRGGRGRARVRRHATPQPPVAPKPCAATRRRRAVALPDWARAPAPEEARPPRPLAPSSLGDDAVADPPPTPAMRAAAERGRLLHALFERLPAVAPERAAAAAERWLASAGGVADAGARAEIAGAALRGHRRSRASPTLFGPDSLAEAPIAASVDGAVVVGHGRPAAGRRRTASAWSISRPGAARRAIARRDPALSSAPDGGLCRGAGGDLSRPRGRGGAALHRGAAAVRAAAPTCSPRTSRAWPRRSKAWRSRA